MDLAAARCIGCGSERLRLLDSTSIPQSITSNVKPWPRSGAHVICEQCAHTQKIQDDTWTSDVAAIYDGYEMYALSGGSEQLVFDASQPVPRTRRLIERLRQCTPVPESGALLDVGCSVGSTMRTFGSMFPNWDLYGFDITTQSEPIVRAIPGVRDFYTGSLDDIAGRFDLVTMLFVVEHLPDPHQVLHQFRRLVKPDGLIWIHTSDFWSNPFDLPVIDHASHFMVDTLAELVERCGFTVIDRNDNWNIKEIGVLAKLGGGTSVAHVDEQKKSDRLADAPLRFRWLGDIVRHAREVARQGQLAILGTSIGGSWLASMVPELAAWFVDEDRNRIGKLHMNRPVLSPNQVPSGVPVYLAFPTFQAEKICERLSQNYPTVNFVVPPPLSRV